MVPSPLQFVRDQPVFRVRGIVLLLCALCRVACGFQVTAERLYDFILLAAFFFRWPTLLPPSLPVRRHQGSLSSWHCRMTSLRTQYNAVPHYPSTPDGTHSEPHYRACRCRRRRVCGHSAGIATNPPAKPIRIESRPFDPTHGCSPQSVIV